MTRFVKPKIKNMPHTLLRKFVVLVNFRGSHKNSQKATQTIGRSCDENVCKKRQRVPWAPFWVAYPKLRVAA